MSDDDERTKRPQPERTEPIRSWSALFGAGASAARAADEGGTGRRREPPSLNDVGLAVGRARATASSTSTSARGNAPRQRFSDRSYGARRGRDRGARGQPTG